jgi:AcrR family transcriptional regulator
MGNCGTKERPGPRKRLSPEEIRARLLDAAHEEFKRRGYSGATTAAICRRAGLAEMQMFRCFPSKAHLFREAIFAPLAEHLRTFSAEQLSATADPAALRESAHRYIAELKAFLVEHAKVLASIFVAEGSGASRLEVAELGLEALQALFDEGAALMAARAPGAKGVDLGAISRVAFGTLLGCATYERWLFPDAARDRSEIDKAIADFILTAVGPEFGPGSPFRGGD